LAIAISSKTIVIVKPMAEPLITAIERETDCGPRILSKVVITGFDGWFELIKILLINRQSSIKK
jgi:hypothetical protein